MRVAPSRPATVALVLALGFGVLAALPAVAAGSAGPAVAAEGDGGVVRPGVKRLIEKAGTGRVPVIVSLDVPGAAATTQPASIRRVRAGVLDALPAGAFAVRARYRWIDAMALTVDQHALAALARHPGVAAVGVAHKRTASMDQANALTGARAVHARGVRGNGVNVAVIDTGIDASHPGLRDDLVEQRCWGGGLLGCTPNDADGHGTHVAGIITGPKGVAPAATFRALKVFSGAVADDADILAALDHVIGLNRARPGTVELVNLSLGGNVHYADAASCNADNPGYPQAFAKLNAQRTAVFVATGNEQQTDGIAAPACVTGAIGVGSVGDGQHSDPCGAGAADRVSCFSNTTPVQGAGELVDLLAPGCEIESTVPGGTDVYCGTSMASPYAAGAAALTIDLSRRVRRPLSPAALERILESTGVRLRDHRLGAGSPAFPRVSPPRAFRYVAPRPDARVKRKGGELRGNNVYGGARRQTVTTRQRPGRAVRFVISVQNDGRFAERLRVRGGSSSRHYRVDYFHGGRNVTRRVVAGNLLTPRLRHGQAFQLTVVVKVSRAAPARSSLRRGVTVRSTRLASARDTVGFGVRRR